MRKSFIQYLEFSDFPYETIDIEDILIGFYCIRDGYLSTYDLKGFLVGVDVSYNAYDYLYHGIFIGSETYRSDIPFHLITDSEDLVELTVMTYTEKDYRNHLIDLLNLEGTLTSDKILQYLRDNNE